MDARELKSELANEKDFVVRRTSNLWLQLASLIAVAFAVLYLTHGQMLNHSIWYAGVLLGVLILLGVIGYVQVQRHRDLLMMTEFQNTLFSSVARLHFRFCMIIKRDGGIVYYDPGLQNMFGKAVQQIRLLDDLFANHQLPAEISGELTQRMQSNEPGILLAPLQGADGVEQMYVLHVDPLPKPRGYVAIRGRQFVERRNSQLQEEDSAQAEDSSLHSMPLLGELLGRLSLPAYALDAEGRVTYANPALERVLGYSDHGIVQQHLTLAHLIHDSGVINASKIGFGDFEGEALFLTRSGGLAKYRLQQQALHARAGGGALGYLYPTNMTAA